MAVMLMGAVFGALAGIVGTALYYEPKVVSRNRRIKKLERQNANISHVS